MREIKKKQYWGLLALLSFLFIVVVGYFMVYPMINTLKDTNNQVEAKQKDVVDMQNKLSSLQKLSLEIKDNPGKMNMLELGIPGSDDQAEIVATISSIAANTGTDVKSISQSSTKNADFTELTMGFETSYSGFKLMLGALENNIRFVEMTGLNLTRNVKSEGSEGFLSGSMTFNMLKFVGEKSIDTQNDTEDNND